MNRRRWDIQWILGEKNGLAPWFEAGKLGCGCVRFHRL